MARTLPIAALSAGVTGSRQPLHFRLELLGTYSSADRNSVSWERTRGRGECLGDSWGRSRQKLSHSQQSSNMTDPKPPRWRKWGRKECLMRCVVTTEEGASPPRPQPTTQRAPSSHSALTGGRAGGGPGCHGRPSPRAAKCRLRSAGVQSSGLWKNTE